MLASREIPWKSEKSDEENWALKSLTKHLKSIKNHIKNASYQQLSVSK